MRIDINIERLVFEGISTNDVSEITSVLQLELSRLVSKNGVDRIHASSIDDVNAGTIRLSQNGKPRAAGVHLARSIYRRLSNHEQL